jgi:hypothetical protein
VTDGETRPPSAWRGAGFVHTRNRTDTPPSDDTLLSDLPRLRKVASEQIELLIGLLDATEDTDTDTQCDDDPVDDLETEPSLCGVTVAAKNIPADQFGDDREGDAHEDDEGNDCEPDAGELPEEENEHHDGFAESEPSLGWPEGMAQGQGRWGETNDRELAAGPSQETMKKAKGRYSRFRDYSPNRDGKHVDSEQGFAGGKRLRNLSDRQKDLVKPKLDREKIALT